MDYAAVFAATPHPCLVLGPDLVIVDVNRAYLEVAGRVREDLVGQHVLAVFRGNPSDPESSEGQNLSSSLHRVLATGEPDSMELYRYDIPVADEPGGFVERWWSQVNTPVPGPDGRVAWITLQVEDVTGYVKAYQSAHPGAGAGTCPKSAQVLETELHARARELRRLNEELRRAHARERRVALTLQESVLHAPDLSHHGDMAVRYLPAAQGMHVGGDWYDVVDIPPDRVALAVGDVVGHGIEAAAVMGMLRSALSAAVRALARAAQSLEVLGLYARVVEGALGATAVKAIVDTRSRLISYSSAGHPPPVLAHPDGGCELLDQATDPPLGVRPEHVPRPQATIQYRPGDTLVLYTDGLIERRGEDIDTGLNRLTDALTECVQLDTEELADTLLARLGVAGGGADDIALIVARL
ncbi:SpoIIE family protein phosphatase [Actinomadura chokoriensis]|uniref:SpoIIE family protein phosphatase n=1 Tax=Actinomadura chokoriensis TaxID=454156 RepID=UPI0031F78C23